MHQGVVVVVVEVSHGHQFLCHLEEFDFGCVVVVVVVQSFVLALQVLAMVEVAGLVVFVWVPPVWS